MKMMQITGTSIDLGPLPFNLHLRDHTGRMILYGKKGIVITEDIKEMLLRENRALFITSGDLDNYLEYSISNLENIVKNRNLQMAKKAEIMRHTGRQILVNLRQKVVDGKTIEQSKKYTEAMVSLVVSNSSDFHHLLNSTGQLSYYSDHALNSSAFCILLGIELFGKADETNLFILGLCGLLHDIGMAHIENSIVDKRDPLTEAEREVIKMHVQMGYNQLMGRELPDEVLEVTLHHHERADGSGYPDGLKGDQISRHTMITAVADVYDALTSKRAFRDEHKHIDAIDSIFSKQHLYEPRVLSALGNVVLQNSALTARLMKKHGITIPK